ncbi:polyphosphate polymerase domain-containing protein [Micromonospora sp. NPDC050686]|uniref:polyphosphate polymerase domain-containing protein n=1 Tax=Micromonospora sp. NPDC050686 TaxID=3154631 RepID=UPI0033C1CF1F
MRLRFNRRARPPDPPTDEEATAVPESRRPERPASRDSDQAGHALRAPSKLHAFNRYEIKYLVDNTRLAALRDQLAARLVPDSHGADGGYGVWSVYYDTTDLRFYWEKIEGLKFRRKLRIRHYGDRSTVDDDSTVHVEIKQRVNRVTQKRRIALPYRVARQLCDERQMIEHDPSQHGFVSEVLELVSGLDLRPVAMTGYQREAFVGQDADLGLRVTLDRRVRGRDRDFHFGADAENRLIVPASRSIVEIKANERVPYWLTDLSAKAELQVVRVSKYCQCVEAYGRAPRSIFHIQDDDPSAELLTTTTRSEA